MFPHSDGDEKGIKDKFHKCKDWVGAALVAARLFLP